MGSKPGMMLEATVVTGGTFVHQCDGAGPVVFLDHRKWEGVMLRGERGTPDGEPP